NDGFVSQFKVEVFGGRELAKQNFCLDMDEARLAVHVRHEQKSSLFRWQLCQGARCYSLLSENECDRVLCKGFGRISIDIPGELIQENDLGEATSSAAAPCIQLTCRGLLEQTKEALSKQGIELWINRPPALGLDVFEPESQDFLEHFP